MFYFNLANIRPELRSNLATIQLLTIVKSTYLNKYGIDKILEPFIQEINQLEKVTQKNKMHAYTVPFWVGCPDQMLQPATRDYHLNKHSSSRITSPCSDNIFTDYQLQCPVCVENHPIYTNIYTMNVICRE